MLSGESAGASSNGLDLAGGVDTVLAINIDGFSGDGLKVESNDNTIQSCVVGMDATGTVAVGNGVGILITGASNLIGTDGQGGAEDSLQGNEFSGNLGEGVWISGADATGNVFGGNWIGLSFIGTPLGNGGQGVLIDGGASGNWVGVNSVRGSENALQLNVISGNTGDGVEITGLDTTDNVVAGDYIGTDPSGTQPVPNYAGVEIDGGASGNLIGSSGDNAVDDALERNIISGNLFTGVWITGGDTEHNVVAGNYIGTTLTGDTALGNGSTYVGVGDDDLNGGVLIDGGASDNLIGTNGQSADDAGERNVISGNVFTGIILSGTSGNVVAGNYLGTTASGEGALGNGTYGDGVDIVNGSSGNWIGVNSPAGPGTENADQGNLISGTNPNNGWGVWIDPTSSGNVIAGNLIGTDASGTNALRNSSGIWINGPSNLVGTTGQDGADDPIERNVISGNTQFGVVITGTSATGNVIAGNYMGTTANGDASLANQGDGVVITAGADNNWIGVNPVSGGPGNADQRDVISGNQDEGISIQGSTGNVVAGDYIGTNGAGNAALGNGIDGVDIRADATNNWIGVNPVDGAESALQGNVISGNSSSGIYVDPASSGTVIAGNFIGTDAAGLTAIPNQWGVYLQGSSNRVGTSGQNGAADALERNVIPGNSSQGIVLDGSAATGYVIAGNLIGTKSTGEGALANSGDGIHIQNSADNNWIGLNPVSGGPENADQGNLISANGLAGVYLDPTSSGNVIAGDFIGIDSNGQNAFGNGTSGVVNDGMQTTISDCTIAGDTSGSGIDNSGTLTVTDSTISDNASNDAGGGISNSGTLTVADSTISDNSARRNGSGGINNSGTATITDSTISDNSAGFGGGISNEGELTAENCTFDDDLASLAIRPGGVGEERSTTRAPLRPPSSDEVARLQFHGQRRRQHRGRHIEHGDRLDFRAAPSGTTRLVRRRWRHLRIRWRAHDHQQHDCRQQRLWPGRRHPRSQGYAHRRQ